MIIKSWYCNNYFTFKGVVLDERSFLPKNTLKLAEFDQKQSLGSGGVDGGCRDHEATENEVGIQCWIPTYITLIKLLNLCPHLKTIRLLTEEKHLAVVAEALTEMDEHFYIEEMEVES